MKNFLVGKQIYLSGLRAQDLTPDAPYYSWLNDLSLDAYTERSYFPNNPARMQSYYDHSCTNTNLVLLGIFDKENDKHIGNITFQDISWMNNRGFIAYILGDKTYAGRGIVTEATLMMMYYGFNRLNFERINGGVSDLHGASKRICEKTGLKIEGRFKNHFYRNGEYSDALPVGATRSEWMEEFGQKALDLFEVKPTY